MSSDDGLRGRTALITGGSRGIGFAIARELVTAGANVVITARRENGVTAAVEALGDPERALGIPGASVDPDHRQTVVDQTIDRFGSLDLLVNNAAVNPLFGPVIEAELDVVRQILDTNVAAPLAWAQLAWTRSMSTRGGVILNVASVGGLQVNPGLGAYGASKAALIQLTRQLAVELAPRVRVNALAPAIVRTGFASPLFTGREAEVATTYPLRRLGEVEDVAMAARYLLSNAAEWVTGQTLVLDGGITIAHPAVAA